MSGEPSAQQQSKKFFPFPWGLFYCFGLAACLGGCAVSQGNGVRNAVYFIFPTLLIALMENFLAKVITWRLQLGVIVLFAYMSFQTAYFSSRVSPERAFTSIFGGPIPTSVTHLEARKQYYDGFILLLSFQASDADFQLLCSRLKLERDTESERLASNPHSVWLMGIGQWASIAQMNSLRDPPALRFEEYAQIHGQGTPGNRTMNILRDPKTGRVWIAHFSDGLW